MKILNPIALLLFIASCTHGTKCDADHPCDQGQDCVDDNCVAACPAGTISVDAQTCKYDFSHCLGSPGAGALGTCTKDCTTDSSTGTDVYVGCPSNFFCDQGLCADYSGPGHSCSTDADCAGLGVEVQR
jgi:hypothetical protein